MRRLTQRLVDALKPRKAAYEVRDAELKGFGVRVGPSGKKGYFLHSQRDGRRIWKFLGGVETISADEARSRAAAALSANRHEPRPGKPLSKPWQRKRSGVTAAAGKPVRLQ